MLARSMHYSRSESAYFRMLYIHLLVTTGAVETALVQLIQYIDKDPYNYRWWGALHVLAMHAATGDIASATLRNARLKHPDIVWGYLYEADCMLRNSTYTDAHGLYEQGYIMTNDPVIRAEICFMQALCGYECHNYVLVSQAIERGLRTKVVHAPLYNIAAYYYAHIGRVEQAHQLISICCSLEPHNYHYQDTALFITYKKGDIEKASIALTDLHSAYLYDATITLHVAKVLGKKNNNLQIRQLLAQAETHAYSEYQKRRIKAVLEAERKVHEK